MGMVRKRSIVGSGGKSMPEANVRRLRLSWFVAALLLAVPIGILAQAGQGGAGGQRGAAAPAAAGPATGRSAAPVDLTGYWVSIVTEDWIERMSPDSPPSRVGRGGRSGGG